MYGENKRRIFFSHIGSTQLLQIRHARAAEVTVWQS
jgi:hypothetical protein